MNFAFFHNASGDSRAFSIWPITAPPNFGAGVYAFAYYNAAANTWVPHYVGMTQDFGSRFDGHHKRLLAMLYGSTHALIHLEESFVQRKQLEALMIWTIDPILNDRQPALRRRGTLAQLAYGIPSQTSM